MALTSASGTQPSLLSPTAELLHRPPLASRDGMVSPQSEGSQRAVKVARDTGGKKKKSDL